MSNGNYALQVQRMAAANALYPNLVEVLGLGFAYDRFLSWVGTYLRESREFHGLDHMLAMSELNRDLPANAARYSMVAGFWHDTEYPSIMEEQSSVSRRFIEKYVEQREGKPFVRDTDDRVGKIVRGIFGFTPGQPLSAFPIFSEGKMINPGGMNEYYSAVAMAGELSELGVDERFITACVAGVEATVPFRNPARMDQLRTRIETVNQELLTDRLTTGEIDEVMIAATHTANKDVSGFLGGLDPMYQDGPTTLSVLNTIKGGDMLSPEEVPALRMKTRPRGTMPAFYTPGDFLKARLKRAGLYHLVLPGRDETFTNLFYGVTLSDGSKYPSETWVQRANKLAYANNRPVRVAEYARLISSGMVYSIAAIAGEDSNPEKVSMVHLVSGIGSRLEPTLPADATQVRKLAWACLNGREQASGHDTRRSPIAELILAHVDEATVEELGKASRALLFPTPKPREYLEMLKTRGLGDAVTQIREQMGISAQKAGQARIAELLGRSPAGLVQPGSPGDGPTVA